MVACRSAGVTAAAATLMIASGASAGSPSASTSPGTFVGDCSLALASSRPSSTTALLSAGYSSFREQKRRHDKKLKHLRSQLSELTKIGCSPPRRAAIAAATAPPTMNQHVNNKNNNNNNDDDDDDEDEEDDVREDHVKQFVDEATRLDDESAVELELVKLWFDKRKAELIEQFTGEYAASVSEYETCVGELKASLAKHYREMRRQLVLDPAPPVSIFDPIETTEDELAKASATAAAISASSSGGGSALSTSSPTAAATAGTTATTTKRRRLRRSSRAATTTTTTTNNNNSNINNGNGVGLHLPHKRRIGSYLMSLKLVHLDSISSNHY